MYDFFVHSSKNVAYLKRLYTSKNPLFDKTIEASSSNQELSISDHAIPICALLNEVKSSGLFVTIIVSSFKFKRQSVI